jgi:hypothetical protein
MGERRGGHLGRRGAMHERHRPERRLADGRTRERERRAAPERHAPDGGGLHQEIVGMLAVDDGDVVERLAGLEDLTVPVAAGGQGLGAEHQVEGQRAAREGALRHAHPPVLRHHLVAASRSALMIDGQKQHAVLHQMPCRRLHGGVIVRRGLRGCLRRLGARRRRTGQKQNPRADEKPGQIRITNH